MVPLRRLPLRAGGGARQSISLFCYKPLCCIVYVFYWTWWVELDIIYRVLRNGIVSQKGVTQLFINYRCCF